MTLYEHAERELKLIGCEDPEKSALLAAVKGYATGGWSGGSHGWGLQTLVRLLEFKPLSDIGTSADEWVHVAGPTTEHPDAADLWQNRRRSSSFSRDGGKTWYDIDDPELNNGDVWVRDDGEWERVELGHNVHIGSRVRVRVDAFPSESRLASLHNGRTGEVVVIDAGRLVVKYDDDHEFRFPPESLQVLKA